MGKRSPSVILLVPGPWSDGAAVLADLERANIEATAWTDEPPTAGGVRVDVVNEAAGFAGAVARGHNGALPAAVVEAAGQTNAAALLEVACTLDDNPELFARLGEALRDAGGVAIRVEAGGAAATWETWVGALRSNDAFALCRLAVTLFRSSDDTYTTCGMHAFDLPDAQLHHPNPSIAGPWLVTLCAFQIGERPKLGTGHTFRPDEDSESRTLERWPDAVHAPNDGRHNPFGVWRALRASDHPLDPVQPIPVFIPTLAALLSAAEQQRERPLTRQEVEAIRDEATTLTMELEDAMGMERSRGYADLEPRRAWEQWQLLAGHD